jgi:hypothetical protein
MVFSTSDKPVQMESIIQAGLVSRFLLKLTLPYDLFPVNRAMPS